MEHSRIDAAAQPDDARLDPHTGTPPADAALGDPDGKIVAIEHGRQRREGRSPGERNRGDRAERRERRKQRSGSEIAEETDDVVALAVPDDVPAVADAALPEESIAELAEAGQRVLTAPLMPTNAPDRAVERTRSQLEAAERAVASYPEVTAAVAPLIRHVNSVTEQLNDAQVNLGRTMAERDALRLKVAELQGIDVSEVSVVSSLSALSDGGGSLSLQSVEAASGNIQPDGGTKKPLLPPALDIRVPQGASPEHVKRVARKRQLIAACLFAAVGIGLVIAQRQGNDISKVSRDSLADLQFVGIFFNMFFMIWMLYRVVRVGGKGASWLFPKEQTKRGRR